MHLIIRIKNQDVTVQSYRPLLKRKDQSLGREGEELNLFVWAEFKNSHLHF